MISRTGAKTSDDFQLRAQGTGSLHRLEDRDQVLRVGADGIERLDHIGQAGAVAQNGIFNNASQHWNHNMFWTWMAPGEGKKMPGALEKALTDSFGSVQKFKDDFSAAGAGQFGSGWAWLVKDKDGALKVTKTENGVNPLCFGQTALLGCDVWEHSYYIDYRNRRPDYLKVFVDHLVNWDYVDELFQKAV